MGSKFCRLFTALEFIFLGFISTCSGQVERHDRNLSTLVLNASNLTSMQSNQSINHDDLSNHVNQSNSTQIKLDKVFRKDVRIFQEYLKDEDLTIILGYREDDDFENWIPQAEMMRDLFPCYMPGFDYQDRPIWVEESGKVRFDKYDLEDQKTIDLLDKHQRYYHYIRIKSQALRSTKERRVTQHVTLLDIGGLTAEFITNPKNLRMTLRSINKYKAFSEKYVAKAIGINVNAIAEVILNLVRRGIRRNAWRKIEIYGTNKYIWAPGLLKSFPKDQLPEKYGGYKGHKPVVVLGLGQLSSQD